MSRAGIFTSLWNGSRRRADVYLAETTLTDAQIKALPTTAVDLVAAPGAGVMVVPLETVLMFKNSATAYTNLSPSGYLFTQINGNQVSSYMGSDTAITTVDEFRSFLNQTGALMFRLTYPFVNNRGDANGWGPMMALFGSDANANKSLQIKVSNAALGNLTGGNAGNKILVSTTYRLVTLPT